MMHYFFAIFYIKSLDAKVPEQLIFSESSHSQIIWGECIGIFSRVGLRVIEHFFIASDADLDIILHETCVL